MISKYETKLDGNIVQIPKWKYLLNWWSPIFGIATILVAGAIFMGSFSSRIFDTPEQKYNVVNHTTQEELHLTQKQRETLVEYKEFQELKTELRTISEELKEINRYLRAKN